MFESAIAVVVDVPAMYPTVTVNTVLVAEVVTVNPDTSPAAALAGATDVKTPKPREATATSAMRLKVVFVDICFLSISRDQEFPALGFG
jgi:hypothetical protein